MQRGEQVKPAGASRMTAPRITMVTPSLNQAEYLERTIRSVLQQDYPDLEYIVMDGGSTDGSVEIIERYGEHLAQWQSAPDRGQADAIAKGFAMSTGDVLGWLNSDDLLLPGSLAAVAKTFQMRGSHVAVAGRCVLVDARTRPFKVHIPLRRGWRAMLLLGHGLAQMATFWTREAYESLGGLDTSLRFSFDYDLFVRLRKNGLIRMVPDYLAAFRVHPRSKTSTQLSVSRAEGLLLRRRYGISPTWVLVACRALRKLKPICRMRNRCAWYRDRSHIAQLLNSV